jgi:hypothetical protein
VSLHDLRAAAADAVADPRTVARVLRGEKVRGPDLERRILVALRVRGLLPGGAAPTDVSGADARLGELLAEIRR